MKRLMIQIAVFLTIPVLIPAQEESPPRGQDVLIEETATIWQRMRLRLVSNMSRLRELCTNRTEQNARQLALETESLESNLEAFADLAASLAPGEARELASLTKRANLLLENLKRDYAQGTDLEVTATVRMVEQTLGRVEELAARSDRRLGRSAIPGFVQPPQDWQSSDFEEPSVRLGLVLLNAEQLIDGIETRREELRDSTRRRLRDEDSRVARELGEMARALVERQGELPAASRRGFVSTALRLEVIAENLSDLHAEGDRLRFRRQLIELQEAIDRVRSYIAIRDRFQQIEAGQP